MTSRYWRRNACQPDSFFFAASTFAPYRAAASCDLGGGQTPWPGRPPARRATSSTETACHGVSPAGDADCAVGVSISIFGHLGSWRGDRASDCGAMMRLSMSTDDTGVEHGGREEQPAPRPAAGDGDVRARRRHVAHERVDLGGRRGSRHDRERRPVGDRARGAGLRRVHPDRQQGRRPHRPQARLRARSARLRDRRAGDGARPGPHRDHRLLGDHRRARRVAAAARDAVAHPRQLRRRGAEARSTRWSAPPPRSRPPSAR